MPWHAFLLALAIMSAVFPAWAEDRTHVSRSGDAPASLAKAYRVSVAAILPDEEAPGTRHVVAPGDTPAGIAGRYGIGLDALDRANPGLDPRNLPVGKVLVIPEVEPAAPPPVVVTRPGQPEGRAAPLVMDFR